MLYRQKKDTYIRNYDGSGYITSTGIWNDRMVNESGTVFLCALSREPQTLDELAEKIIKSFVDVDICGKRKLQNLFSHRMFFGTDFPISHWYEHYGEKDFPTDEKSLTESYKNTIHCNYMASLNNIE